MRLVTAVSSLVFKSYGRRQWSADYIIAKCHVKLILLCHERQDAKAIYSLEE
jgi:hypothetical protein